MSSPKQGVLGGCGLGRAYNHIKVFSPVTFPLQRKISGEGILGQYPLSMLVENTALYASGIDAHH